MRWWMGLVIGWLWFGGMAAAHPTLGLPEVSLGEQPYKSFTGEVGGGVTDEILTVPEGQEFIMTTVHLSNRHYDFLQDTEVVLTGILMEGKYLKKGISRLRIEEGTKLYVRGKDGGGGRYSIQGFFVNAGSPYRFVHGNSGDGTGTTKTIFTADDDRAFIVRALIVSTSSCDVSMDELFYDGRGGPFYYAYSEEAFSNHRGTLVIPPGGSLQVSVRTGLGCDYLMNGEYITP